MLNGKQYLAIAVGYAGAQISSFAQLTPEIPLPVARSSAIWVFELQSGERQTGVVEHSRAVIIAELAKPVQQLALQLHCIPDVGLRP